MYVNTHLERTWFTTTKKSPQAIELPHALLCFTKSTVAGLGSTNAKACESGTPTHPPAGALLLAVLCSGHLLVSWSTAVRPAEMLLEVRGR